MVAVVERYDGNANLLGYARKDPNLIGKSQWTPVE